MQFIFSTGSLYTYSLDRCFDFAAQAGFAGVELMVDQRWDTRQPDHLKGLIDRHRLPIVAVHSPFFGLPGWPQDQPSLIQKSITLAEAVGAKVVVHHLPIRTNYVVISVRGKNRRILPMLGRHPEKGYQDWLSSEYQAIQAQTEIRLCIENMPARRWLNRRWNVHNWNTVEAIRRFPSLTMDTTHLGTWGIDPSAAYAHWRDKVGHIHLSNFDGREHRRPEAGQLKLDQLLARLAEDGYAGAISFELHPDALEAGAPDKRVVTLLSESLSQCRAWAEQPKRSPVAAPALSADGSSP